MPTPVARPKHSDCGEPDSFSQISEHTQRKQLNLIAFFCRRISPFTRRDALCSLPEHQAASSRSMLRSWNR